MVSLLRTDSTIKRDVEDEIKYDPSIDDNSHIAVAVKDGVVTLTGFTKHYMDSYYAEKAAKRVAGVKGVANDIQVRLASERTDPEVAEEAVKALKRDLPTTSEDIKVVVKNGYLTLEGDVEWFYQKEWAERAVRSIAGVKSVSNLIHVKPRVSPSDVKRKIEDALVRSAKVDADKGRSRGQQRDQQYRHLAVVRRPRSPRPFLKAGAIAQLGHSMSITADYHPKTAVVQERMEWLMAETSHHTAKSEQSTLAGLISPEFAAMGKSASKSLLKFRSSSWESSRKSIGTGSTGCNPRQSLRPNLPPS